MPEVNEKFYNLKGLDDDLLRRLEKLNPRRLWLRRLAFLENIFTYYKFSVSSILLFQESCKKDAMVFENEQASLALAFYNHARICLASLKELSEEAVFSSVDERKSNLLQDHRDKYSSWAQDTIKKRNSISAHPTNNVREMIVSPSSWGTGGKITFATVDLEHITKGRKEYELEPVTDMKKLREYIEKTVVHLKSVYDLT